MPGLVRLEARTFNRVLVGALGKETEKTSAKRKSKGPLQEKFSSQTTKMPNSPGILAIPKRVTDHQLLQCQIYPQSPSLHRNEHHRCTAYTVYSIIKEVRWRTELSRIKPLPDECSYYTRHYSTTSPLKLGLTYTYVQVQLTQPPLLWAYLGGASTSKGKNGNSNHGATQPIIQWNNPKKRSIQSTISNLLFILA